ncbi:MAG: presenilin family intramembrane aspartyl protease, partial [Candidatus Micrarchaeaceae archaeon]
MPLRVIEYRQLIQILVIFLIVQFLGLLLATQVYSVATLVQVTSVQAVSSSVNALFYIIYVVVVSAILLFLFKIFKGDRLFVIIEGVVIFIASAMVFLIALGVATGGLASDLFGAGNLYDFVAAAVLAIALVVAKNRIPRLRNFAAILASVGVGAILGITFSFFVAFIFMVLLAVYDFIAVFITKHMVALADMAINKNLAFLVMVNEIKAVPERSLSANERAEFERSRAELVKRGGVFKNLVNSNMVPVAARTALGTGDLAMPLMMAVAAYKVFASFTFSIVIIIGATFGLILTMLILRKFK